MAFVVGPWGRLDQSLLVILSKVSRCRQMATCSLLSSVWDKESEVRVYSQWFPKLFRVKDPLNWINESTDPTQKKSCPRIPEVHVLSQKGY